jgi:hypothetical protein
MRIIILLLLQQKTDTIENSDDRHIYPGVWEAAQLTECEKHALALEQYSLIPCERMEAVSFSFIDLL